MKPFEELANAVLDGIATPQEQAALTTMLERDPHAREQFRSLELAVNSLGQVREVEVPADLRDQILDAVRAETPPWAVRTRPVPSFKPSLGEKLSRAMGLRLVSAFAAGIAAGAIVFTFASGGRPLVQGPTSGTLAPPATTTGVALAAGEAQAAVEMSTAADIVSIRISTRSIHRSTVEISWPSSVGFVGFESDAADSDRFQARAGQAVVDIAGPNFEGILRLRGSVEPAEIAIRLRADRDVDETRLTAPRVSR